LKEGSKFIVVKKCTNQVKEDPKRKPQKTATGKRHQSESQGPELEEIAQHKVIKFLTASLHATSPAPGAIPMSSL
jgi:hypothetical protein